MNKTKIIHNLKWLTLSIIMGIVLGGGLITIKAWTEPTQAPPGGNIGAPINTSINPQAKIGGLQVNGFRNLGTTILDGNVGIGTVNPAAKLDVVGNIRTNNQVNSDLYCDYNGNNCKSIENIGGVTQAYVDSKFGDSMSLSGYKEVPTNIYEDYYGSRTNFTGPGWSDGKEYDTCNRDPKNEFSCSVSDEKICIDVVPCGRMACRFEQRNVTCKKGVILQKVSGNFTKNLNYTDLWNLYGREMYGSGSDALTNAQKICSYVYGLNYVSHTTQTHGTSCGKYYHVVNWNGSSFQWIGLGCGGNVTVLDTVSCKS